jgi:hypothetical protein
MHRRGALVTILLLASCQAPRGPLVIDDPDPSIKIPAMREAALQRDKTKLCKLVAQLDSDDPAVRFYAINSLKDLTGETFGYVYYEDDDKRKPAVVKWKKWIAEHCPAAATQPGPDEPKTPGGGGKQ